MHILVVDDEEGMRELLKIVLTKRNFSVETASTGEEAVELFKRHDFDLVIQDIRMPGMGGKRCLQELLKRNSEVKVLVASGYSRHGPLEDLLQFGAADYVAKPFGRRQLLAKIREILDR